MMTLLLAFVGAVKADVVTIGEGTSTTYVTPFNSLWGYSFVEQIFTADEIGTAGTITSISFNLRETDAAQTNAVDVYMLNVSRSSFSSSTDYEPVTAADMVFSGTVTFSPGWTTITLDTPFEYDGSSNLLIGMHEYTSGYSTRYFYYTSATDKVLSYHSDSANPDPYNLGSYSGNKYTSPNRANIQIDITAGGGGYVGDRLHVRYMDGDVEVIDSLNMGVRPINAWMEPFNFTMYTEGPAYTVTVLDFTPSDGMFSVSGEELPFQVTRVHDVDLTLATNATQAGVIERQFVAITEGDRAAHIWPVVVELYAPEVPDVWELACEEATTFPFVEVPAVAHHTMLHNDYTLPFPEMPEGLDAVYKLTFDEDQILNAEVTYGDNGKVALYTEDFYGEGGPMADNNYTGLQIGGGASGGSFEAFIGDETSTSALTYFPFHTLWNYSLAENLFLASELTEAGVTSAPMTSLSWYVSSTTCTTPQNGISIWMANVSDAALTSTSHTTAGMTLVYTGANILPVVGWNEFEFNEGTFSWDGHSNILILCQRQNGSWEGSVSWQTHNPGFAATSYAYTDNAPGYDATTQTYSMSTSTTNRANIIMKSNRGRSGNDPAAYTYTAGPVITDLPVRPGTYYLVASSTTPNFEVTINAQDMPCPDVETFALNPTPADDADGIEPGSVTLRWNLPANATGWRLFFGTTYHPEPGHPQTIIYPEDGSFTTDLANSYTVRNLWNNTNYFWRVEFNNDGCPGGVSSPVWGFTTHLNIPQNLTAVDYTVFDDETIVLNWNPVVDRTYRMYNVYRDGELIGSTQVNNINNSTYTDGPLAYNMGGYTYYVTAVYDEGESAPSDPVTVKVSGYGNVDGHVYEQDGMTGIAGATVTMTGLDEFNVSHTYNFTTNNQGYYSGHIYAGTYNGQAAKDGYQTIYEPVQGNPIDLVYNQTTSPVDYMLDENFDPVCSVLAEYYPYPDSINAPYVKVSWGCGLPGEEIIEPFETGDFSLFDWQVDPTYPWTITTNNPYEGMYCMKSGGAGVNNVISNMTVTVNIPADGLMSFFGKISCENSWDYGYFYIDGVQKASFTGAGSWVEKQYEITEGDHTFMWQYTKDGSVNSNDDCFYVDYITFYKRPEPPVPGMTYDFEDGTMQGWTSVDADGDGYGWYMGSEIMTGQTGNNGSNDFVLSQSYYGGLVLYPDNYLVSPQVALGGIVTFYACAQDASYAAEHFGLAVSTTNTNPSSFTTVQEWTMTAKGVSDGGKPVKGSRSGRAQGNWYQYTVDLSAYAGQTGYVAIRHFNCSDMFYLNVDDITIGEPGAKGVASNDRALSHYRVYRTNCYNDGPYTEDNTVLLATVWVPDTVYIDVNWPDVAPGVYKWGVGTVYVGNRGEEIEGPISWAAPMSVNRDVTADATTAAPVEFEGSRALWDQLGVISCTSGYQYGVATDGQNIYTSAWSSSAGFQFAKYDMDGNFIETFNVSGSGYCRDITYDGQYFYGVATSSTVYCLDLANQTLVSTFTSGYGAMRCIGYDAVTDGFWVVGNWSGNLSRIDRTGAVQFTGPTPSSASGVACYVDNSGDSHVLLNCQPSSNCQIDDYNVTTNILTTNVHTVPTSDISGGMDIAQYNGTLACFASTQGSPNTIYIYDLDVAAGPNPGPTPGGNNPIQEERESEIVWSNCLDKDMYLNAVTVNVLLNSADSPEGTTVDFTNLNEVEQQNYPVAQLVLDESGYYAFQTFRRGDYAIQIRHEGYEPIDDTVSIWNNMDLRYVMTEILYGVGNVYVSRTGWAMWDEAAIPGGGGGQGGSASTFNVDFEGGLPEGWTVNDANNDGWTWCLTSAIPTTWTYYASLSLDWYHSGTNAICSGSYINGVGAISPDEYLISPQVNLANGSQLSFWVAATDANYAADHFGVFVSTTGTNPSDFQSVQEWTLTGKSEGKAGNPLATRDGEGLRLGTWYHYTVDLSAYAGSNRYIAFRHFNCYDQYIMCLDDIELTSGAKDGGERHLEYYKVLCTSIDGVPIFNHNTVHPFCQLSTNEPYNAPLVEGEHYLCKVAVMYSTGMSEWSTPVEWEYEPCDHWGPVDEVTVGATTQGNHIEWVFDHGYNPYGGDVPGPGPGGAGSFQVDFEGGMPEGWTVIDANNDGWTWCMTSNIPSTWTYYAGMTLDWYHNGTNAICSGSYINGVGALNPDEYLVSPLVNIAPGSQLSFWVAATDASYAADHFGVCVSDDGTSNWAMVQEWTLTGKKQGLMGGAASRDGEGLRLGTWYNYTVDLSAYAGQKHIAFRHFNCYDQYIMCLDDIELIPGAKGGLNFNKGGEFYTQYAEDGIMLNFLALDNVNLRVYLLYVLSNDSRFSLVPEQEYGQFVLTSMTDGDFMNEFEAVYSNAVADFDLLTKVDIDERINHWKNAVSSVNLTSVMMDVLMSNARPDNDHCVNSLPFCTSEEITFEAASTSNTANEPNMDDGCIGSSYNPSFYHMRIHTAGPFVIHMEGHDPNNPSVTRDIDFCMWGPYTEQEVTSGTACSSLTGDKIMDCCYSAQYDEDCYLGYPEGQHNHHGSSTSHGYINYHVPEVGEYYILMITNFSQQPCVINFTKTEGEGETDCDIVTNPDIIGFLITQDGEYLAFAGPDDREYYDLDEYGDHEYCVRPIYPGEMVLPDHNYGWSMGCPVCEFGPNGDPTCEPGAPIHAEVLGETDQVKVWWGEQPAPGMSEWLYYDNGTYADAIGTGGSTVYWAAMFPAASIAPYAGTNLTKVALYEDPTLNTQAITVAIYLGGSTAPQTMVSTQTFNPTGTEGFHEVALNTPVAVDGTQNMWIVFSEYGTYPATGCTDTGDANGRWISVDGVAWEDVATYGLNYTWMIRGFVTNEGKGGMVENIALEPVTPAAVETSNMTLGRSGRVESTPADLSFMNRSDIVKYNVYRSNDNANYTMIGEVAAVAGQTYYEYIDTPAGAGTYYYQVRADYGDCESEPAMAAEDPANNYVTATVDAIGENSDNVALFPNPTNGNVTIQANGMSRITVVSVLGQVVYDKELNADEVTLNMGQFNAGLYMVRVYTESGVTVKRVTVMQ